MKKNGELFQGYVKGKLIKASVMFTVIAVFVLGCIAMGYRIASGEERGGLGKAQDKFGQLSNPVAVYEKVSKEIDISVLSSEVRDIGELATVEYLYTDAAKHEADAKVFGKELPFSFTTKYFVIKWDGVIKAGVNVSKIRIEDDV